MILIKRHMIALCRTATAAHKRLQPHGTFDPDRQSNFASVCVPSGDSRTTHRRAGGDPGAAGGCQPEGGELRRRGRHRDDGGRPGDAAQRESSEPSLGLEFRHEQPQRTEYVAAVLESSPGNGESFLRSLSCTRLKL